MDISMLRERKFDTALTITELNSYIKRLIDGDRTLSSVSVVGEISNLVYHGSGHIYFSLKDNEAQIKAIMFRSSASRLKFALENGMRVVAFGSVSVYTQGGSYQLYANTVEPDGVGALYLSYERLKEKLSAEGLFNPEYKKEIPALPETVGVITSPMGAAVRDIINVTRRRYPLAKIYLYPSLVQGDGAAENLCEALDYFDKTGLCDVVIIGRGGGSLEDLFAFNDERVARRIFAMKTPVISAVGHETDFTIADFVADMRAPTPSAAAELAVPDIRELYLRVDTSSERLKTALQNLAAGKRRELSHLSEKEFFKNPELLFAKKKEALSEGRKLLSKAYTDSLSAIKSTLLIKSEKINALNPLAVLTRGFSVTEINRKIIKSAKEISVGDKIEIRLADGRLGAEVFDKKEL